MSTRTPKPAPSSPVSLKALIALQQQIAKNEANRRKEVAIDAMRNVPTSGAITLLNERLNEQRPDSSDCDRITSEASKLDINANSQMYISNFFAQLLYYAAFVATPTEISNAYTDSIRINGAVFSLKTFLLQFENNIDSEGDFTHLSKTLHTAFLDAANEATNPYFADALEALAKASKRITHSPADCLKTLRGSTKGNVFKMPTVKQIDKLTSQTKPKFDTGKGLRMIYRFGSEKVMNRNVGTLADSALLVAICQVPFLDKKQVYVRTPLLTIMKLALKNYVDFDNNLLEASQRIARAWHEFKHKHGTCPMTLADLGECFEKPNTYANVYSEAMSILNKAT